MSRKIDLKFEVKEEKLFLGSNEINEETGLLEQFPDTTDIKIEKITDDFTESSFTPIKLESIINENVLSELEDCQIKIENDYQNADQSDHSNDSKNSNYAGEGNFLTCYNCQKTFRNKSYLDDHLRTIRRKKCLICKEIFNIACIWKCHIKKHKQRPTSNTRVRKSFKPLTCAVCQEVFYKQKLFTLHAKLHTDYKPYKCIHCNKCYSYPETLSQHQATHLLRKPFECDICTKRFSLKSYIKAHMVVHDTIKRYKCHLCNKSFRQESRLKEHIAVHTYGRQFECEQCDASFVAKHNLKAHMKVHSNVKFQCNYCHKSYKHKRHLVQHTATHTMAKPFKCSVCGESYKFPKTLKYHMSTHTALKRFECDKCNAKFAWEISLHAHQTHEH